MSRRLLAAWSLALLLAGASLSAQQPAAQSPPSAPPEPTIQEPTQLPPEEDGDLKTEQYSFNPVKSKRDVAVGLEYFKKGNYKAAADRFTTATKWNEGNADAWLRLGEAEEKRGNTKAARAAYSKYLELSPDSKNASEVKKRLEKLKV
jgi:tetratricopeptide (TPR) repeat protein